MYRSQDADFYPDEPSRQRHQPPPPPPPASSRGDRHDSRRGDWQPLRLDVEGQGLVDINIVEGLHSEIDEALRILQGGSGSGSTPNTRRKQHTTAQRSPPTHSTHSAHSHGIRAERRVSPPREVQSTSLLKQASEQYEPEEAPPLTLTSSQHTSHSVPAERSLEQSIDRFTKLEDTVSLLLRQVESLGTELAQTKKRCAELEAHSGTPSFRRSPPASPLLLSSFGRRDDRGRSGVRGGGYRSISPPARDTSMSRGHSLGSPGRNGEPLPTEGGGTYDWRGSLRSTSASQRRCIENDLKLPGYIK